MVKKRTKHPKLPNGFGSIRYLGNKRRKPYQALGPAEYDKLGKAKRPTVGFAEDWYKAYDLLVEYHDNPYDLDFKKITFSNIFDKIEPIIKKEYEDKKMSKSNYNNLLNAYKNSKILYKEIMLELRNKDFQNAIDQSGLGYTSRGYMKNLYGKMIKYCKVELEMPLKIDNTENINIGQKEKSELHYPFSIEEIKQLWDIVNNANTEILRILNSIDMDFKIIIFIIKLILISIYTGLRPKGLTTLENEKIFLEDGYMIGGCKTEAGRDRIIPIHPCIKDFIREMYDPNNKYLIMLKSTGKVMSTDYYKKTASKVLKKLHINHTPYDTRHTFATRADEVGISETNIKVLMGHSLSGDVTNSVYIHKSKDLLINEVKKIYFIEKGVK